MEPDDHPRNSRPSLWHALLDRTGPGERVEDNLAGDDSRIIMDRAFPFIEDAVAKGRPFFTAVWFHTPHLPVVAGPDYLAMYEGQAGQRPHYYGCITAMDEQVGRLRSKLDELGVAENTIVFFCSDNGPEGRRESDQSPGATYGLRGRKRSLYEGGIRVPGLMVWPAQIAQPVTVDAPACTSDYLPTLLEVLGVERIDSRGPLDGVSFLSLIQGEMSQRGSYIGFKSTGQRAWIGDRYKLIAPSGSGAFELYDLLADPAETNNLALQHADLVERLSAEYLQWDAEVEAEREDAGR